MRSTTTRRAAVLTAALATGALLLTACGAGTPATTTATEATAATKVDAVPAAALSDVAPPVRCDDKKLAVESYAPDGTVAQLAQGQSVTEIRRRGRLIVGTSADVLLWGARDPESGQLQGFDILMAQEIAKAIFGDRPNTIEYRVINYAQRLPALSGEVREGQQKGPEVDVVLHTMTINCKRWEQIAFSSEYYHAGQKLIVRADDPSYLSKKTNMQITDLAEGTRICVPAGSTNEQLLKDKYAKYEAVPVPEIGECLVKFQRGEVSAITGDDTVLAGFAVQDPYAKVVSPVALSDEPYGIGVRKDKVDLVRFINAVLEQVRKGRWAEIYAETMGRAIPTVPKIPPARYGR